MKYQLPGTIKMSNASRRPASGVPGAETSLGALAHTAAALRSPRVSSAVEEAFESARGASSIGTAVKAALDSSDSFQDAVARAKGAVKLPTDLMDRMSVLRGSAGPNNAIGTVAEQIAKQQLAIDHLGMLERDVTAFRPPDFNVPPNPLFETNKRLKRIEDRFEQMQGIAGEAASIANGLQAAAAEFLAEFKVAARENSRAARRAIGVGVIAVVVTFSVALGQVAYHELWRVPADNTAMHDALVEMKSEFTALREQLERLTLAIETTNDDLAKTIDGLADHISSAQPTAVE